MTNKKEEKGGYTAKGTYKDAGLSASDKAAMGDLTRQWNEAAAAGDQAGMDAAHAAAEALRAGYGYSGGEDGSEYIPLPKEEKKPSGTSHGFSYGSAPSYADKYTAKIESLLGDILSRDKFSYDALKDPLYQQYKESYTRGGEQAMKDALGQVSARTGGLASSYAGSVAQQTYDGYMDALADKVPELYQLAYSMYLDDIDSKVRDLGLLQGMSDSEYGRYRDTMSDWRNDRDFAYGVYRDDVADERYAGELAYQIGRDQLSDQRYQQEYADSRADTEWERLNYQSQQEYERALQKAQLLAAAGDFSGYAAMGYSASEIANLKKAYDKAQAASAVSGSSGSRYGNGVAKRQSGSGSSGENLAVDALEWAAKTGGDATDYIKAYYKSYGYSSQTQALSALNVYQAENRSDGFDPDNINGGTYGLDDLDMASVLQLGIGPISYDTLSDLMKEGKVIGWTDEDGNTFFKWADGYNAQNYKTKSQKTPGLWGVLGK